MTTPQKCEPSKVIGSISKFAGTLVGTAVVTGKRIVGSVRTSSESPLKKTEKKTVQVPVETIKKVVHKPATTTKRKKKKVVKRKAKGLSAETAPPQGKPAQSPSKKKKLTTIKKKTV